MRPQHLTQVAHEGNPVECSIDVLVSTGGLESPNPFDADGGADLGGPILFPRTGSGGIGGDDVNNGDNAAVQPIIASTSGPMDCVGSQSVTITLTGGIAPFTWGTTLGVLTPSSDGRTAVLTPPVNGNPTYAPSTTAFQRVRKYVAHFCGTCSCSVNNYNCAGEAIAICFGGGYDPCLGKCGPGWHCSGFFGTTVPDPTFSGPNSSCTSPPHADVCADIFVCSCDMRNATMQSNGCNPCDTSFNGAAVVTATDGEGHQAYVTVQRAGNFGGP